VCPSEIGLRGPLPADPTTPALYPVPVRRLPTGGFGFLQIPPRDGHPCLALRFRSPRPAEDFHLLIRNVPGTQEKGQAILARPCCTLLSASAAGQAQVWRRVCNFSARNSRRRAFESADVVWRVIRRSPLPLGSEFISSSLPAALLGCPHFRDVLLDADRSREFAPMPDFFRTGARDQKSTNPREWPRFDELKDVLPLKASRVAACLHTPVTSTEATISWLVPT
jgi:hypothetical protein